MVTRRIFLKSSGMAMVTLGFAPSFLARTAEAAGTRRKLLIAIFQRGAVDGLNMIVPFGEAEYYRVAADDRDRRSPARDGRRGRSQRVLRPAPADGGAQAVLGQPLAGDRARVRLARQHALALRRAGLHGVGDARRQEHAGTAGSIATCRSRTTARRSADRGRDDAADAALAAGHGAGAGDGQRRRVRRARRHGRTRLVRSGVRGGRGSGAQGHGRRRVQRDADAVVGRRPAAVSPGERRARIRARRSASRCRRSRGWPRPTSASRSRLPRAASGTTTSTKAARPARSPIASTTSRAASPRSRRISAIAWPTRSS